MAVRSVNVNTLWKSKSQIVPAGKTKSDVMVLVTYRGPSAHAGVLPVTGVSTPSMVPTVSTAPTMADRLMTILLSAGARVAAVREFFMVIPPGFDGRSRRIRSRAVADLLRGTRMEDVQVDSPLAAILTLMRKPSRKIITTTGGPPLSTAP